ncbi:alpha/beta fold hydrolase [Sphaerisporangium perillae]|uniref:alpha/beta fold hydrolase n=1 Tax=Sphaerisporangium perillae TaxID=2935860 RepID=UPI002010918D|nr:alpha/beta hydrolase [Sphaerisporangium perillae]
MTEVTIGSVTSADGTTIGYRRLGRGPGVVLLHGAMESSHSHIELAEALSADFTCYLPDRRGRGLSGPQRKDHGLRAEVEDVAALLAESGAHLLFGVSAGAAITLRAALACPTVRRAVVFDPPLPVDGSLSTTWLERLDRETAEGKVAAALVTGMKGAQMGPKVFDYVPRRLLELLTTMAMAREDRNAKGDDVTFRALASTLGRDVRLAVEMSGDLASLKGMRAEVLLLGGARSPAYMRVALDALEKILPDAERVELAGLGHSASGNAAQRGAPDRVARELRRFFTRP